jgi:putative membrane protein
MNVRGLGRCGLATMGALGIAGSASAHEWASPAGPWWAQWSAQPAIALPLALSGLLYAVGVARLWASARVGVGVRRWEAAAYAAGWLALVMALLSPLHPLGELLFSAHMGQHELLMLVAAPLLVLGRPVLAYVWALPRPARAAFGRVARVAPLRRAWTWATVPLVAWVLHAAVLWVWHLPVLFEATLDSEGLHALQHLSFLGSALLFWWALVRHRTALGYGAAVLYVFSTSAHTGLLGALLTMGRTVWYPAYTATAPQWGLAPLEDQQLGGLIMWVPAGAVYVVAALCLMVGWLREAERATERRAVVRVLNRAPVVEHARVR